MANSQSDRFLVNLDWNLLRSFVVIAEEKSITRAATRLMRRQPAVSLALKRLETELGVRLVDRGGGTFRLTAAGQDLYREAADIYGSFSRLRDVAHQSEHELSGHIHILLASHVMTPLLDDTLAAFYKKHPKVTYTILTEASADVSRQLHDKQASLGICLVNKKSTALSYKLMYREFFGFFCGPNHPLFGREDLSPADLRNLDTVSFETDDVNDRLRPIALLRQEYGLDQNIVGRSYSLEEVRRMVYCGLGIGSLPLHVVARDVHEGLLWRLPPLDTPPAIDIYLVTNPAQRFNRAEKAFIQALETEIARTPLAGRTYG